MGTREMKVALCLLLLCLCIGLARAEEKQVLATIAPATEASQSRTVTPRPERTDFTVLSLSVDSYRYPDRFDSFGSSFFRYFGFTSVYGIDDEDVEEGDDDDFIFGDDDDGGNDDGADDDDEEVVFNDVAPGANLLPSPISVVIVLLCF